MRLLVTMVISIYISRLLVDILGMSGFGVFSVVSSSITLFSFINNSLSYGTQRFISYELGKLNEKKAGRLFLMSLNIHLMFGFAVIMLMLVLAKPLIFGYLTIPKEMLDDAYNSFIIISLTFSISLMTTPYNGLLIAKEKFDIIALFGVIESILKLTATLLLYFVSTDFILTKYSLILFFITFIIRLAHVFYCHIKINFVSFRLHWCNSEFKDLFSFSSWGLFGGVSSILMNQGVNILLNVTFGPLVNAARALSMQVNSAVSQFSSNLQMVFKPRIIKSYAEGDINSAISNTLYGAKFNVMLIGILALPFIYGTDEILSLWIGEVPDYTDIFVKICVVILIFESMSGTLMALVSATGNITKYQVVVGTILLCNLPLSFLFLKINESPEVVLYVQLFLSVVALLARLIILNNMFEGLIRNYLLLIIKHCIPFFISSYTLVGYCFYSLNITTPLFGFIFLCVISVLASIVCFFVFGADATERDWLFKKLRLKSE
ncbi:MATE family efflux transporter [Vibrio parahaemolyticus]|nr:MATE family efflux transporter [Vibrio parahaemolyticus]MRD95306.1 hypothetical protein [Vibrio parahaemolyticus]ODX79583.1 hypothetical protein BBM11_00950 [Vibrio parahaemolyticus]